MRVLVTGGFGFLGAFVTEYFATNGHEVYILSRSAKDKIFVTNCNGVYQESKFPFYVIEADLVTESTEQLAKKIPLQIDVIIHAASFNETFEPNYGKKSLQVNVFGTQNLLEAIALKNEKYPLFIYVSTFHVYGQLSGKITESTPVMPLGDYGLTHYLAEEYCQFFYRKKGIPCIITRCTNGYGAPKCTPFGKWYLLLADLCYQAFQHGEVVLQSSPLIQRDFIWLGDIAQAIGYLASRRDLAGNVYNLGRGKSYTLGGVASIVASTATKVLGRRVQVITAPEKESPRLDVDISSLSDELDMKMKDMFEQETTSFLSFLHHYGKQ